MSTLFLPDRCDFEMKHCDTEMTLKQSSMRWEGQYGSGLEIGTVRYVCDLCGTSVVVEVTELS